MTKYKLEGDSNYHLVIADTSGRTMIVEIPSAPTSATVYVVFLGPGIKSTLGGFNAGEGYAAYHNFVNLDGGEVRYVGVPFDMDFEHQTAVANSRVRRLAKKEPSKRVDVIVIGRSI